MVRLLAASQRNGVRFSLDPPDVAVAEWFRRLAVNQPTRVRFSPVTPFAPIVQRERALVS